MKILVADVGGTFIKHAVMNENAEILSRGKIPTPMTSREDFLNAVADIFKGADAEGIALSLPGVIDAERGVCVTSGALKYNDGCNVVAELEKICGVRVTIENDAKSAALAEVRIGSLADVSDGFVMVFGTAVGGAFIKNRELHRGRNFSAGEISYTLDGRKHFGITCGVPALLKDFAKIRNIPADEVTGEKFFDAVGANEKDAVACLDRFARRVAVKIFDVQMLLDVERFAIGGGISAQESFIAAIRRNLDKTYRKCAVGFVPVEVVPCKFRNDANLIGALYTWLK